MKRSAAWADSLKPIPPLKKSPPRGSESPRQRLIRDASEAAHRRNSQHFFENNDT